MLIMNPTPVLIKAKHDGGVWLFLPNERKEISNTYAARHIINRWGPIGLVDITYTPAAQKKFGDNELYVHEQAGKGIQACYEYHLSIDNEFETYDQEWGDRKHPIRFKHLRNRAALKKIIEEIEQALKNYSNVDLNKLLSDKANDMIKQAEELQKQAAKIKGKTDGNNAKKSSGQSSDRNP